MTPYEQLDELYATLPTVDCKQKCQNYCGPIIVSKLEATRMQDKRGFVQIESTFKAAKRLYLPAPPIMEANFVGIVPPSKNEPLCVFLSSFGRCSAYSIRPLVCRLWGMMDNEFMRCPHGCKPTRWVTGPEARELHLKIIAVQNGQQ
jgi:Fe-S-cluster containining protein